MKIFPSYHIIKIATFLFLSLSISASSVVEAKNAFTSPFGMQVAQGKKGPSSPPPRVKPPPPPKPTVPKTPKPKKPDIKLSAPKPAAKKPSTQPRKAQSRKPDIKLSPTKSPAKKQPTAKKKSQSQKPDIKLSRPKSPTKKQRTPSPNTKPSTSQKASSSRIWAGTKTLSGTQSAFAHWKDHRKEFPEFQNAKQYVEAAKKFVKTPPKDVLKKQRENGDVLFYQPKTNTFAVVNKKGLLKTMFRPKDGMTYWNKQK